MPPSAFDPAYDDLAPTVPIFPLTGVLLLPRAQLPLNVFEPRYLNMTFDALAADRMIGIVQPRGGDGPHGPQVYNTACAGRIVSFAETDDGRLLITLRGVARFEVGDELPTTRGYRRVHAGFAPFADDLTPVDDAATIDRDRFTPVLRSYFDAHQMNADWSVIDQTPDEALISSLAMICPFEPPEKQALLECTDMVARCEMMITLMEMHLRADGETRERPPH
ncbi:MAG: LON peptidase substrate-binding domain-containing protein [Pseudomonadota bacterium]